MLRHLTKFIAITLYIQTTRAFNNLISSFPRNLTLQKSDKLEFSLETYFRFNTQITAFPDNFQRDLIKATIVSGEPEKEPMARLPVSNCGKTEPVFEISNRTFARFCGSGKSRKILIWKYLSKKQFLEREIELIKLDNMASFEIDSCSQISSAYNKSEMVILCQEKQIEKMENQKIPLKNFVVFLINFDIEANKIVKVLTKVVEQTEEEYIKPENAKLMTTFLKEYNINKLDIYVYDHTDNKFKIWVMSSFGKLRENILKPKFKKFEDLKIKGNSTYKGVKEVHTNGKFMIMFPYKIEEKTQAVSLDILVCTFGVFGDCLRYYPKLKKFENLEKFQKSEIHIDVFNFLLQGKLPKTMNGGRIYYMDYIIPITSAIKNSEGKYELNYMSFSGGSIDSKPELSCSMNITINPREETKFDDIDQIIMMDGAVTSVSKNKNDFAIYYVFERNQPLLKKFKFFEGGNLDSGKCWFTSNYDYYNIRPSSPFPSDQLLFCANDKEINVRKLNKLTLKIEFIEENIKENFNFRVNVQSYDKEKTQSAQVDYIEGRVYTSYESRKTIENLTLNIINQTNIMTTLPKLKNFAASEFTLEPTENGIQADLFYYGQKNEAQLIQFAKNLRARSIKLMKNGFILIETKLKRKIYLLKCSFKLAQNGPFCKLNRTINIQFSYSKVIFALKSTHHNKPYFIFVLGGETTSYLYFGYFKNSTIQYTLNRKVFSFSIKSHSSELSGVASVSSRIKKSERIICNILFNENFDFVKYLKFHIFYQISKIFNFEGINGYQATVRKTSLLDEEIETLVFEKKTFFGFSIPLILKVKTPKMMFSPCWNYFLETDPNQPKLLEIHYYSLCNSFYASSANNINIFNITLKIGNLFNWDDREFDILDSMMIFDQEILILLLKKNDEFYLSLTKLEPFSSQYQRVLVLSKLNFTPENQIIGVDHQKKKDIFMIFLKEQNSQEKLNYKIFYFSPIPKIKINLQNFNSNITETGIKISHKNVLTGEKTLVTNLKLKLTQPPLEKIEYLSTKRKISISSSDFQSYNLDQIFGLKGAISNIEADFKFCKKKMDCARLVDFIQEEKFEKFSCFFKDKKLKKEIENCEYFEFKNINNYLILSCRTLNSSKFIIVEDNGRKCNITKFLEDEQLERFGYSYPFHSIQYFTKSAIINYDTAFREDEVFLVALHPDLSSVKLFKISSSGITSDYILLKNNNYDNFFRDSKIKITRTSYTKKQFLMVFSQKNPYNKERLGFRIISNEMKHVEILNDKIGFNSSYIEDFSLTFDNKIVVAVLALRDKGTLGVAVLNVTDENLHLISKTEIQINYPKEEKDEFLGTQKIKMIVNEFIKESKIRIFLTSNFAYSYEIHLLITKDYKIKKSPVFIRLYRNMKGFHPVKIHVINEFFILEGYKNQKGNMVSQLVVYKRSSRNYTIKEFQGAYPLEKSQKFLDSIFASINPKKSTITQMSIFNFKPSSNGTFTKKKLKFGVGNILEIKDYRKISLSEDFLKITSTYKKNSTSFTTKIINLKEFFESDFDPMSRQYTNKNKVLLIIIISVIVILIMVCNCICKNRNKDLMDDIRFTEEFGTSFSGFQGNESLSQQEEFGLSEGGSRNSVSLNLFEKV